MELEFEKKPLDCLRQVIWEVKNEEQTQDFKLTDTMPDVGRVLASWGQVLLRGKEWRGSSMGVSGGVLVWILYEPEDAGALQTVEAWVPFSLRWDFPPTKQDGAMMINCQLRTVDARAVSARKLMIRTVISAAGEALEPVKCQISMAGDLPEDVQLLKKSYPVCIGTEAGEKSFSLEDELVLPSNMADPRKILACNLQPSIRECKIVAGKAVMRGIACVHLVYLGQDSMVYTRDFDLPFSQYSELDRDYEDSAGLWVQMAVTELEPELKDDGRIRLKCGLVGQYVVYDTTLIEVVEDAYSIKRPVSVHAAPLQLWQVLDRSSNATDVQVNVPAVSGRGVDLSMLCCQPTMEKTDRGVRMETDASFQMLYYDGDGRLQSVVSGCDDCWELAVAPETVVMAICTPEAADQPVFGGDSAVLRGSFCWESRTVTESGILAVTGLELGEMTADHDDRPSLILCRVGEESLWSLAKRCGSTVEAIQRANALEDAPEKGRMLLVPLA